MPRGVSETQRLLTDPVGTDTCASGLISSAIGRNLEKRHRSLMYRGTSSSASLHKASGTHPASQGRVLSASRKEGATGLGPHVLFFRVKRIAASSGLHKRVRNRAHMSVSKTVRKRETSPHPSMRNRRECESNRAHLTTTRRRCTV